MEALPGFGDQKARSVVDVVDKDSLLKVRAFKQSAKAAARAAEA